MITSAKVITADTATIGSKSPIAVMVIYEESTNEDHCTRNRVYIMT